MRGYIKKILFVSLIALVAFPYLTMAGSVLYFEQQGSDIEAGARLLVGMFIDSDEAVNAYEVVLSYPTHIFSLSSLDRENSIIDVWKSIDIMADGVLQIGGGSTKPFKGEGGLLIVAEFRVIAAGSGVIKFSNAAVYQADTMGSSSNVEVKHLPISVQVLALDSNSPYVSHEGEPVARDSYAKKTGIIAGTQIIKNPMEGNMKLFVFDSEPIYSSQLIGRSMNWMKWGQWHRIRSPHPIESGVWLIEIRAAEEELDSHFMVYWPVAVKKLFLLGFTLFVLAWIFRKFIRRVK